MTKYAQIKVGDSAELRHIVTQKDIERFVELTGDDNKLHVDARYAATTAFKKPVAHGMLSASFISTIIGTKLPGDGALWFSQSLEFLLPVRIGDEITVRAEVIAKVDRMEAVELRTEVFKQSGEKVITGIAKVRVVDPLPDVNPQAASDEPQRRTAIVLGATGGIGSATCLQLARDGFDIVVHYHRNQDAAERLVAQLRALGREAICVAADVTDAMQAEALIKAATRRFEFITTFVNCTTARLANVKFENLKWEDFQTHFAVNIRGNLEIFKHLVPLFKQRKSGSIVLLSSQVTDNTPPTEWTPYVSAKYALNGFARALAMELSPFGIRLNLVSPGMTDTDLISDTPERARLVLAAKAPLRRLALPEDVAGAISFLVSDKAKYLTGETLRVNGGQAMI